MRQRELEENRQQELKTQKNDIYLDDILKELKESCTEEKKRKEIEKKLETMIEKYNKRITDSSELYYKQGFQDAMNLWKECK